MYFYGGSRGTAGNPSSPSGQTRDWQRVPPRGKGKEEPGTGPPAERRAPGLRESVLPVSFKTKRDQNPKADRNDHLHETT